MIFGARTKCSEPLAKKACWLACAWLVGWLACWLVGWLHLWACPSEPRERDCVRAWLRESHTHRDEQSYTNQSLMSKATQTNWVKATPIIDEQSYTNRARLHDCVKATPIVIAWLRDAVTNQSSMSKATQTDGYATHHWHQRVNDANWVSPTWLAGQTGLTSFLGQMQTWHGKCGNLNQASKCSNTHRLIHDPIRQGKKKTNEPTSNAQADSQTQAELWRHLFCAQAHPAKVHCVYRSLRIALVSKHHGIYIYTCLQDYCPWSSMRNTTVHAQRSLTWKTRGC